MGYTIDVRVSQLCKTLGCVTDTSQYTDAIIDANTTAFTVAYYPPKLGTVSPNHGPTTGGYSVFVSGSSLGGLGDATVTLHSVYSGRPSPINLPVVAQNHTVIEVTMQPAAGTYLNISVTVGGQSDWLYYAWNYDPPVIYEILPPLDGRNWTAPPCRAQITGVPCVQNWLPSPIANLFIYGINFGPDATYAALSAIVIKIGDDLCSPRNGNPTVFINDTCLSCTLSNANAGNKSVSLTIANQTTTIPVSAGLVVQCDKGYTGQPGTVCAVCRIFRCDGYHSRRVLAAFVSIAPPQCPSLSPRVCTDGLVGISSGPRQRASCLCDGCVHTCRRRGVLPVPR